MQSEESGVANTTYESYTVEWYENVVKKNPEYLKWFNETVMTPDYQDLWKD